MRFRFDAAWAISANFRLRVPIEGALLIPIQSFFPEAVQIIKPLNVVVQNKGGDYLASFPDANINASGDTECEAVSNLKDMIVATLELLLGTPENRLGPGPRKQLGVLSEFLVSVK